MSEPGVPFSPEEEGLYNSRLIKSYLEYLNKYLPDLDVRPLLEFSGLNGLMVENPAQWLTQRQVDRFHEILVLKTNDTDISRKVGRYAASAKASGAVRQYTLGFLNPQFAYRVLEKIAPHLTKACVFKTRRLGSKMAEVVVTVNPGVEEKQYQCENRLGMLESMADLFTGKFASIEHTECIHRGGKVCRYLIQWEKTGTTVWKKVRNYTALVGGVTCAALFLTVPTELSIAIIEIFVFIMLLAWSYTGFLERRDLTRTIQAQGDVAKDLLEQMNIRYNNALLVQEIGQATSTVLDIEGLLEEVVRILSKRLDFDRGGIWLANEDKSSLNFKIGYGYDQELQNYLAGAQFHLDKPESRGVVVQAFREQTPSLVNEADEIKENLSGRSRAFLEKTGSRSFICVPLVYEGESLGALVVDNIQSKRQLDQGDMNLLMGVASQTAVSIVNARSFQRLQESEKKYRELVENANSIIMRVDTGFRLTFFNEFAQKFFGYQEHEILGKDVHGTLFPVSSSEALNLARIFHNLKSDPENLMVAEGPCIQHDGRKVIVAWTFKAIYGPDGRIEEILCIGNDVTDLKKAAEENKTLEMQLQQAQKMEAIGTLAGGIAHDFNNILTAIMGYAEIAKLRVPAGNRALDSLEEVLHASHRARDLVKQILSFSRQGEQKLAPLQISPIVKEALKLLRASMPTTIEIRQEIESDAGIIKADPTQVHQVLMNLCTNALHSMQENGGILTVQLGNCLLSPAFAADHPGVEPGAYLRLSVRDTGQGIPADVMERIFEPYFTTKKTGEGTGLGLAVVHGIIKSHGGVITVSSREGEGTAFDIYVPVIEGEAVALAEQEGDLPRGEESILFVDDEPALVELGKEMLEYLGYRVTTRTSSLEALELFRSKAHAFDLVMTDMTMPYLTGDRLAQEILKINANIPVILCTGFNQRMTDVRAKEMGMSALLMKPLAMQDLAETIRRVLNNGNVRGLQG